MNSNMYTGLITCARPLTVTEHNCPKWHSKAHGLKLPIKTISVIKGVILNLGMRYIRMTYSMVHEFNKHADMLPEQ